MELLSTPLLWYVNTWNMSVRKIAGNCNNVVCCIPSSWTHHPIYMNLCFDETENRWWWNCCVHLIIFFIFKLFVHIDIIAYLYNHRTFFSYIIQWKGFWNVYLKTFKCCKFVTNECCAGFVCINVRNVMSNSMSKENDLTLFCNNVLKIIIIFLV